MLHRAQCTRGAARRSHRLPWIATQNHTPELRPVVTDRLNCLASSKEKRRSLKNDTQTSRRQKETQGGSHVADRAIVGGAGAAEGHAGQIARQGAPGQGGEGECCMSLHVKKSV